MGVLYIVKDSPFKRRDWCLYLKLADKGDAVIFIQNGVYAALSLPADVRKDYEEAEKRGVKFYFLKEDAEARGIKGIKNSVDYDGFLDLIERYEKIVGS